MDINCRVRRGYFTGLSDSSPRKIFSTFLVNLTEIIKSLCNPKINFLVTQRIEKWSHIFILAGEVLNNFLQYLKTRKQKYHQQIIMSSISYQ